MIFGIVSASDRIAPVHGEHPSERMRHFTTCSFSPSRGPMNACSGIISEFPRINTSRSFAKYSGTIGMFSR